MSLVPALKSLRIKNFMSTKVITVFVDDHFSKVFDKMNLYKIRHLPVVDKENLLVGLITQRDLYRAHSPRKVEDNWVYDTNELDHIILKHHMTPDPHTLEPDHTLEDALKIMVQNRFSCVPITQPNSKKLAGIVTYVDILEYFYDILNAQS